MSRRKKNCQDGRKNNGKSPGSIAALKAFQAPQFPPGLSANPGGKPKIIADSIQAILAEKHPDDQKGRTYLRLMNEGAIMRARRDPSMFREIADRIDGPVGKVVSGPDGGAIPVKMTLTELDEQLADLIRSIAAR